MVEVNSEVPFCPFCGVKYDQHYSYCINCGKRIPQQGVPPPQQMTWHTPPEPPFRTTPPQATPFYPYPTPMYPARPYYPSIKAPLVLRCFALIIDSIITGMLIFFIMFATIIVFPGVRGVLLALVTPFFAYGYLAIKDSIREGRSIGKGVMGLRVVDLNSGRPATFVQSSVRNCCCGWCDWYCCCITVLLDRDGRRIGDQIAGTVVIRDQ